ncbi:MAG: VWA domain-containing protein [Thermoplasmata archaeon]
MLRKRRQYLPEMWWLMDSSADKDTEDNGQDGKKKRIVLKNTSPPGTQPSAQEEETCKVQPSSRKSGISIKGTKKACPEASAHKDAVQKGKQPEKRREGGAEEKEHGINLNAPGVRYTDEKLAALRWKAEREIQKKAMKTAGIEDKKDALGFFSGTTEDLEKLKISVHKDFENRPDNVSHRTKEKFEKFENCEAVVLAIDCSQSMNDALFGMTKLDAARIAVKKFVERKKVIARGDIIAIVAFGMEGSIGKEFDVIRESLQVTSPIAIIHPFTRYYEKAIKAMDSMLQAFDGTPLAEGLKLSGLLLSELDADVKQKRIIVISDGRADDPDEAVKVGLAVSKNGIIIDCIGFGERKPSDDKTKEEGRAVFTKTDGEKYVDEDTLFEIAKWGGGDYLYAKDPPSLWAHYDELAKRENLGERLKSIRNRMGM